MNVQSKVRHENASEKINVVEIIQEHIAVIVLVPGNSLMEVSQRALVCI
jgi:hypothetical protein